jgi:hypothetical protein
MDEVQNPAYQLRAEWAAKLVLMANVLFLLLSAFLSPNFHVQG